ncbi:MAG TPA: FliH/SctL family protein [Terracidiphilus sp.]|nr:FliH/SctL family protein [Terracidiphilus sp.]
MHNNGTVGGAQQNVAAAALRIELFEYPAGAGAPSEPAFPGWNDDGDGVLPHAGGAPEQALAGHDAARSAELEQKLAEEIRRSFEAGRVRGLEEGRQAERAEQGAARAAAEAQRKNDLAALVERFARERDRFLAQVEREVVVLALAVAARILRREAQMDPLLLTGAVRVALGQLATSTEVRLRVPQGDVALWQDAIAHLPNLNLRPTVEPDAKMRLGDCVVETALGSVDLGVRSQLGEIERGFFDRAVASPDPAPRETVPAAAHRESR